MTDQDYPLQSLRQGHWFKLICGASFQHLPAVRNLTLAYTLAGADCIDVAADPAVICAAKEAIVVATQIGQRVSDGNAVKKPLLMVSLNDGDDPHFRKAEFIPNDCPSDCARPCERVCPADAIDQSGVDADRCYGCGRCLPICPIQHITARSYVSTPQAIAPLVLESGVDAIEIHTQVGRFSDFERLWSAIAPWGHELKLLAISCPDGEGLIDYLWALYRLISPLPCTLIWQTDGRPMSGDIGTGATRAAIKLGQKVLLADLPGYVQLAGGTNQHTVPKLRSLDLLASEASNNHLDTQTGSPIQPQTAQFGSPVRYIAGVAYGSYARSLLSPILEQLESVNACSLSVPTTATQSQSLSLPVIAIPCPQTAINLATFHRTRNAGHEHPAYLENESSLLQQAVNIAQTLVSQLKSPLTLRSGY